MAISSLLFAIILHFYKNTRKDKWVRFHSEHRFVIAGKKKEHTDVGSAAAVMQHTNTHTHFRVTLPESPELPL